MLVIMDDIQDDVVVSATNNSNTHIKYVTLNELFFFRRVMSNLMAHEYGNESMIAFRETSGGPFGVA